MDKTKRKSRWKTFFLSVFAISAMVGLSSPGDAYAIDAVQPNQQKVFDQQPSASQNPQVKQPEVFLTPSLENVQLLHDEGTFEIKVFADLTTQEKGRLDDIYYGAYLGQGEGISTKVVDRQMAEEKISIKFGQIIPLEVVYAAPEYLNGSYDVWIFAQDKNGMTLSKRNAGKVTLKGSGEYVEIVEDSCRLYANEKKADATGSSLYQGFDVKAEEKMLLSCQIINHLPESVEAEAVFENHFRNFGGELVAAEKVTNGAVKLESKEKKEFLFTVPKALEPQAYDAVFSLVNKEKELVSNVVPAHYVLSGTSATIHLLQLDKENYAKGEQAMLSVVWTGAADSFLYARHRDQSYKGIYKADIQIKDGKGNVCATLAGQVLDKTKIKANFKLESTIDCQQAAASLAIKDDSGKVLMQKVVGEIQPAGEQLRGGSVLSGLTLPGNGKIIVLAAFLLALISLLVAVIFRWKNDKQKNKKVFKVLFFLLGSTLFFWTNGARADYTFGVPITWDWPSYTGFPPGATCDWDNSDECDGVLDCNWYQVCVLDQKLPEFEAACCVNKIFLVESLTYQVALDKYRYDPGETMNVSGSVNADLTCGNMPLGLADTKMHAHQGSSAENQYLDYSVPNPGQTLSEPPKTIFEYHIPYNASYEQRFNFSGAGSTTYQAQNAVGDYAMFFDACHQGWTRDPNLPSTNYPSPKTLEFCYTTENSVYWNLILGKPVTYEEYEHYKLPYSVGKMETVTVNLQDEDGKALALSGSLKVNSEGTYKATAVFANASSKSGTLDFVPSGTGTITLSDIALYTGTGSARVDYSVVSAGTCLLTDGGTCSIAVKLKKIDKTLTIKLEGSSLFPALPRSNKLSAPAAAAINFVTLYGDITGGTATGQSTYKFYCKETDALPKVIVANSSLTSVTQNNLCTGYTTGAYNAKLEVERNGVKTTALLPIEAGVVTYTLTPQIIGLGTGKIDYSDPAGAVKVCDNDPGTVTAVCGANAGYAPGSNTSLTAQAYANSVFDGWQDCTSVSGSTCDVLMNANKSPKASFKQCNTNYTCAMPVCNAGECGIKKSQCYDNCGAMVNESFCIGAGKDCDTDCGPCTYTCATPVCNAGECGIKESQCYDGLGTAVDESFCIGAGQDCDTDCGTCNSNPVNWHEVNP